MPYVNLSLAQSKMNIVIYLKLKKKLFFLLFSLSTFADISDQSNNKENNIVDIAMSMAGGSTVVGSTVTTVNSVVHNVSNGPAKKMKTSRPSKSRKKPNQTMVQMATANHHDNKQQLMYDDTNILDMNNGNGTDASELQYIILQSDTKIFSCSNCEQQFISEDFLKQHIQKAHPIVTELVQTPALSPMSMNQQVNMVCVVAHYYFVIF